MLIRARAARRVRASERARVNPLTLLSRVIFNCAISRSLESPLHSHTCLWIMVYSYFPLCNKGEEDEDYLFTLRISYIILLHGVKLGPERSEGPITPCNGLLKTLVSYNILCMSHDYVMLLYILYRSVNAADWPREREFRIPISKFTDPTYTRIIRSPLGMRAIYIKRPLARSLQL